MMSNDFHPYQILLVDDHAIVRSGMAAIVRSLFGQATSVIEASNLNEACSVLETHPEIAMVLLDLSLPDTRGLEGVRKLRRSFPEIPLVVVSGNEDAQTILDAYRAGAIGFIPKSSDMQITQSALRLIMSGGQYLPPSAMSALVAAPRTLHDEPALGKPPPEHGIGAKEIPVVHSSATVGVKHPWQNKLSARQAEVLKLMTQGLRNKEIAREMGVSDGTIKNHVAYILHIVGASNRAEAIAIALTAGFPG